MFHERLGKSEYVHIYIFDMNFRWYVNIMNIYESYIAKLFAKYSAQDLAPHLMRQSEQARS